MRYAVLSDIHANLEALTAVLAMLASERIDHYLCLGDIVGYGADPVACLTRLQDCQAVMVGGNHDLGCIGKLDLGWFNETARAGIIWTRDHLSFADLDALRRLPLTTTVEPSAPPLGAGFTLVHATLRHPERFEYLVDVAQMVDTLQACRTAMCLVGHTHVPYVVEYDRGAKRFLRILTKPEELSEVTYQDDAGTFRYLVNPGSVGQPRDGDSRAACAIIDSAQRRITIHRVPYDIAATQRKMQQTGLPAFLAERLAMGR